MKERRRIGHNSGKYGDLVFADGPVFILCYTIAMITVFFAAVAFFFFISGKTFVFSIDGLSQHFMSLAYYGRWLRQILKNVFILHSFSIPSWSADMGYGADILTTLHYYVIGDPLNLLAVFVPEGFTEALYILLIFARMYLAGLAFLHFILNRRDVEKYPALLGSLCYVFCGFALYVCVKHPYFINPLIYAPLLAEGIDRVFDGKKPWLFIAATALSALSNMYFFYMLCVMMFIYAIFRYFSTGNKLKARTLFPLLGRFILFFACGVCISGVILIPEAYATLSSNRMTVDRAIPVLYSFAYYWRLLAGYTNSTFTDSWLVLGFNAFSILCTAVLFSKKKQLTTVKIAFAVLLLFCLVPYAGHLLNGASYVSNRWSFAYAFLMSYITVKIYPYLFDLTNKEKLFTACCLAVYALLCFLTYQSRDANTFCTVLIVMFMFTVIQLSQSGGLKMQTARVALLVFVCLSIMVNSVFRYSPTEGNYVEDFQDAATSYQKLTSSAPSEMIKELGDSSFFRYDKSKDLGEPSNTDLMQGLPSTDFYYSLSNSNVGNFNREMSLDTSYDNWYTDLNGRSYLQALTNVKYYLARENDKNIPYLFKNGSTAKKDIDPACYSRTSLTEKFVLYTASDSLPFGYTYSACIPRSTYEALSPVRKQQALLQGAVTDADTGLPAAITEFTDSDLDSQIKADSSVIYSQGCAIVTSSGAGLSLEFTPQTDAETYIVITGLHYTELDPSVLKAAALQKSGTHPSTYEELNLLRGDLFNTLDDTSVIKVSCGSAKDSFNYFTESQAFYSGRHDYLINLGSSLSAAQTTAKITFSALGRYTFDSIEVVSQPMSDLTNDMDALKEDSLQNVNIGEDLITGDISLSSAKLLVIPMADSSGWTAYVDGEKTDIINTDTMFMGIMLDAGHHDIRLVYKTPLSGAGEAVSAAGICAFAAAAVICGIKKKKRAGSSTPAGRQDRTTDPQL